MIVRIVEDTPDLARLLPTLLDDDDIRCVVTTSNFGELLFPGPWQGVHVALVDFMLPGITGEVILRYLKDNFPNIRRILWTAAAELPPDTVDLADVMFYKPVKDLGELIDAIRGRR